MLAILTDRSFTANLVTLLISAIVLVTLGFGTVPERNTKAVRMSSQEMVVVKGNGTVGSTLLAVGLTVAVLGMAAVVTGGVVIVALAAANVTTGAATAAMVVNAGLYATTGGGATAAIGATINWLEGR